MNRLLLTGSLVIALVVAAPAIAEPPITAQASSDWEIADLGTLGGDASFARAVNNKRWVVGESEATDGRLHAFLWRNGVLEDLGTPEYESAAWDINDQGQVVGTRELPDGSGANTVGFIWENGSLRILALGGREISLYAINDRDVVGDGSGDPVEAFRFSARSFSPEEGLVRILSVGGLDDSRSARDIV